MGRARQMAAIVASGDRREALATIVAPTVVIHGEADPLVPVEGAATPPPSSLMRSCTPSPAWVMICPNS
uniref:Serine aminopeptidase S33 domain-containing protein n=1 Tax=Phenylobacterium glaciei TaxID=2803784 RepID=A0A974S756_9CAUL|nr:hypothetical protein JKL49_19990 [Phenylobacterium glaciei]